MLCRWFATDYVYGQSINNSHMRTCGICFYYYNGPMKCANAINSIFTLYHTHTHSKVHTPFDCHKKVWCYNRVKCVEKRQLFIDEVKLFGEMSHRFQEIFSGCAYGMRQYENKLGNTFGLLSTPIK